MASLKTKINKGAVDDAEAPATGQAFIWDTEVKGYGLRVTSGGTKTFIVQKRIGGKDRRVTLGRYPEITAEAARKLAMTHIGEIASGNDPIAAKATEEVQAKTLREVIADYLDMGTVKASTAKDLQGTLNIHCAAWMNKPVTKITRDMVAKLHAKIGKEPNPKTGGTKMATANKVARYLKLLLNFTQEQYRTGDDLPIIASNATAVLKKRMYKVQRRTGHLEPHQIKSWWQATGDLQDSARDYLRTMLLTGLRSSEAISLKWADVDLEGRTFTVRDTKNGTDHTLPMGAWLTAMIAARPHHNEFVFSSERGRPTNRRGGIDKAAELSGLDIQKHDLRRTFLTVADAVDVPYYALKALVNHKSGSGGDVTAGYIQTSIERLRKPMQAVEDYILSAAGVTAGAEVVELREVLHGL
ncbi:integrase family protein [Acidithiobacillus ferruginosus]|uniref:Integrase family protein n=1 Tax=Acidithiobacillus ferruginosus TaxID=3063951 RepID=A0ACD5IJR7_9PROT|nr:integrase family protein [Acidithiobacillus ferruginosus]MBU2815348.1 integrase family protein [Acidithiobacillus ferruginosus]